jgi:hypothetical protein
LEKKIHRRGLDQKDCTHPVPFQKKKMGTGHPSPEGIPGGIPPRWIIRRKTNTIYNKPASLSSDLKNKIEC